MRKFEKAISTAVVAAISLAVVTSVSSIARAGETEEATPMQLAVGFVSRTEAKKIVRAHLKENDLKNFRVSDTERDGEFWVVIVSTLQGTPVKEYRVNSATGELGSNA